jgi:serine/threonine protein kinase
MSGEVTPILILVRGERPSVNRLPDDETTDGDDSPWSEVPGPGFAGKLPDANALGQSLASIDLVTSDDFRTVADLHQHDTGRILNELQAKGVITPFQRARLAEGRAEALQMDEYIVIDRIGVGGMGEVFKARNRSLDRIEAIKTMNAGYDPSSSVSQRFHREAKLLARIEHPSIVPIYKVGHALGVDYIAMKYIEGVNLKEKVDQAASMGQLITINQAVDWISQAASALAKAHEASIIHRDIKPGNLMLSPEGRLFILDLGIARLAEKNDGVGSGITRQASAIGTPEFMPPEQWADATTVTPETDIYALGCTLFYLLTGRPPFIGDKLSDVMHGHTSQAPPSLANFRSDVPDSLDQILAKMLAKDPEERYRDAQEVVDALRKVDHRSSSSASSAHGHARHPPSPQDILGIACSIDRIDGRHRNRVLVVLPTTIDRNPRQADDDRNGAPRQTGVTDKPRQASFPLC